MTAEKQGKGKMTMEYFEKVIGYEDIKFELARIIDIMNHPAKYAKLGG